MRIAQQLIDDIAEVEAKGSKPDFILLHMDELHALDDGLDCAITKRYASGEPMQFCGVKICLVQ